MKARQHESKRRLIRAALARVVRAWRKDRGCPQPQHGAIPIAVALLLCSFTIAFGAKKAAAPLPVWPPAPEQPRIAYVQSITQPSDLGVKNSVLGRIARWIVGTDKLEDRLIKPFGIALDESDNLCVTDTGANTVVFFDASKKRWHRWDRIGKLRFGSPVAVAKRGDKLFVADSTLRSVIVFNTEGKLLFTIQEGLERPAGVAASGTRLFVVDSQLNRVFVYNLEGKLLSQFGQRGLNEGDFNFPTHIALDRAGDLLVTDSMNGRVQVFAASGQYKRRIGSTGDRPGHFGRPKGVAADSDNRVYAVDALYDNVQIFDRDGRLLLHLGSQGVQPGEFWLPNGIAITRDNRIYISDSYNRRIQVLKYVGPK